MKGRSSSGPRGAMGVGEAKATLEERDSSLAGAEGGLFLVPIDGCMFAWCMERQVSLRNGRGDDVDGLSPGEGWGAYRGPDLGIEGRNPSKAAAQAAKFGGKFPCNLRCTVMQRRDNSLRHRIVDQVRVLSQQAAL